MALENGLTLLDYLGAQKKAGIWDCKKNLLKDSNIPNANKFDSILSICKTEKNSGLTAADYLENPVKVKIDTEIEIPNFFLKWKPEEKETSLATDPQKENREKSERTAPSSVGNDIERSIIKASRKYDLPSELIKGVIKAESDFQVDAESSAGALGLMQLMPATAEELGVKDPFDIDQNIDAGTRYLKNMMDRFGNDPRKALAAYNAGPGTVERYDGKVPYKETRHYVERVLKYSGLTA